MNLLKYLLGLMISQYLMGCSQDNTHRNKTGFKKISNLPIPDSMPLERDSSVTAFTFPAQLLISPGQTAHYTEVSINNNLFKLVLNESGDTIYLSTNDIHFNTPEGYHVGDFWQQISKADREKTVETFGWGYTIQLKSGWQLGFCEGGSCTETFPKKKITGKMDL